MSTATSEPTTTNALFASAAATLAQFVLDHPGPDISSITLDRFDLSADMPRLLLHVSSPQRMNDLAAWVDLLDEPTVTINRFPTYIAATLECTVDDTPVMLWGHLAGDEVAALWSVLDDTAPDMHQSVQVSVAELHRAASGGAQ